MGNESSSSKSANGLHKTTTHEIPKKKISRFILHEKNSRQDSLESNDSGIITTPTPAGIFIRRKISAPMSASSLSTRRPHSIDSSRGEPPLDIHNVNNNKTLIKSFSRDHAEDDFSPEFYGSKKCVVRKANPHFGVQSA
ncbi:unnamed protein product [Anisakis simplex]|uniref:Serine/threonine-protein kinase HAL5-like n=1 Tax=Anisakis simplex TaxID=6269 RepID=A0A0M3K1U6_ANISI|nr:unnamed protein product [Anisakis simplex]